MKRWVSGAMAFIITFSCAQGSFALANEAVEEEIVSALAEESGEAAPVVTAAAETVDPDAAQDEVEYEFPSEDDGEPGETKAAPDAVEADAAAVPRYARIAADAAEIHEAPDGAVVAALETGSTVLVLDGAAADWTGIAFYTEQGIVTGWIAAGAVRVLDAEETSDYLDALAGDIPVALFNDDINTPLERVACTFAGTDAAAEAPAEEPTEESETETDGESVEEPQAAPDQENTEQDAEEARPEGETEDSAEPETELSYIVEAAAVQEAVAIAAESEAADAAESSGATDASGSADAAGSAGTADAADTAGAADTAYAAEAAEFKLNMAQCVLGLKEGYSGLAVTGGTGTVSWSSSNNKIVKVNASTGVVKGVKKGSAVVTATSGDGKTASVKVTVKAAPKKIKFSPAKLSMGSGEKTVTLKLKMTKGAASAGTTYTSSNESVATVDSNGVVTSHSAGTAVITARTYNKKKAACKVTVYAEPAPSAIKLPAKVSIGLKESRTQLAVELVPAAGESSCTADITWSSTNKKVVKVDPATGAIKGLKKGSATIVAKTSNGLKAKCKVTVKKAPKKVTLKSTGSAINVGSTVQYSAKLPKGTAGGCTYTSSNTAVATIDENGLAQGVGAGQTTITVKTYNGKTAKATLTVNAATGTGSTDTSTKSEISVPSSMEKLGIASYQNVYSADMSNEQKLEYVIYHAQTQLGKPYVYGKGYKTANPTGFDCSGFVYWCFYKLNIELGESAYKQGYDSRYTKISDIDSLKRGDVVCFNTESDSDLSDHTGIYLGNGYFIHASSGSSKKKVLVQRMYGDSISSDYYKRNFSWGRRILP